MFKDLKTEFVFYSIPVVPKLVFCLFVFKDLKTEFVFYSIPVDGTCDETVDGCKDVGDGDDDDYDKNCKVSFVSKNKYLFRLCRVSREKKIGKVLSFQVCTCLEYE